LAQRLTETRAATADGSRLDPYARSLVEHTTESTERDISWLDRLIAAERARPAHVAPTTPVPGRTEQTELQQTEWQREPNGLQR
jgi:hypothetical protein